ncbi:MAG: hypothetical protein MUP09_12585 [Thiovulaceae bacterium]|nr:hypothetical protein [Sulfurimonadaceae bacterium]
MAAIRTVFIFFIFLSALRGDTLVDKLREGNVSDLTECIKDNRQKESEAQTQLRALTEQPKPAVEGIGIQLFRMDVDRNTSIGVEYAPELRQGEIIDNKEQTTIKLEHKF